MAIMVGMTSGTMAPDLFKGRHFDREIIVPLLEVCTKPTDARWGGPQPPFAKSSNPGGRRDRRAVKVCNLSLGGNVWAVPKR